MVFGPDQREGEPHSVTILEIGPRNNPATKLFDRYPGANIVFVANESFDKFKSDLPEGSTRVEVDVVDYLGSNDPSIPERGFDIVVAAGVLSQPPTLEQDRTGKTLGRRAHEFARNLKNKLIPGGQFILEEHYLDDSSARVMKESWVGLLTQAGFLVSSSTDKKDFIHRTIGPEDFQIVATKPQ